jgi:hypothetical protein
MTQDEALKLARDALEALENISTALREDDVLGSDIELMLDAITTIRETLAQPDEDAIIIQYHEMTIKRLEKRIEELTAQTITEEHIAKVTSDIDLAVNKALAQPEQEPEYWNVIDPAGNVIASETDAIRGWARIAGSYKPTVEGLLGLHEQGWRVLPKVAPPMPEQERNFCPRCGKRTADLTTIHTCTPPQENT